MIARYSDEVAPRHARPQETKLRVRSLLAFFGHRRLCEINGALCRRYAAARPSDAVARRELEDMRAALNHFHAEGYIRDVIKIILPERRPARERWLTRGEAARLLHSTWRFRESQHGAETARFPRRHLARFILVALYAGRRAGAIVEAALQPTAGHGWIDLERGAFHPRAGQRKTKKRQPPIILPRRLLAHMRRWKAAGQNYAVEWNGAQVLRVSKGFRAAVADAGLSADVTPHVLRHTCATWMMQRSADPWAAAGYLGLSLETLIRVYGHHHPDHLRGAWSVFDRPGGEPKPRAARKAAIATKNKRRHAGAGSRKSRMGA